MKIIIFFVLLIINTIVSCQREELKITSYHLSDEIKLIEDNSRSKYSSFNSHKNKVLYTHIPNKRVRNSNYKIIIYRRSFKKDYSARRFAISIPFRLFKSRVFCCKKKNYKAYRLYKPLKTHR